MAEAPEDAATFRRLSEELAGGIDAAIEPWVVRCVERLVVAYRGEVDAAALRAAADAGEQARRTVVPEVRALLEADVDEQRTTPLAILRKAVRFPTAVLRSAGVPPVVRDEYAEAQLPDDPYDLTPVRLGDLDPALDELALRWGAAKAFVVRARHRP